MLTGREAVLPFPSSSRGNLDGRTDVFLGVCVCVCVLDFDTGSLRSGDSGRNSKKIKQNVKRQRTDSSTERNNNFQCPCPLWRSAGSTGAVGITKAAVKLPSRHTNSEMEFPDDLLFAELGHLELYNESLFQKNFSDHYNGTDALLPTGVKVTIVVVYMIVCVIGLVGNFLVMYVIIRYTKMKTATNIYIFNLALADSLFLATLPFQGTDVFLGFWPFGNALCKAVVSIDYYNMFTSTFTLTVMSMDRYVAVCHPVKALDMRTPHKAKVVNICVWVLASAFGVPAMVMGSVEEEEEHNSVECIVVLPEPRSHWDPVFGTCVFFFSFLIPVAIISICYSLMVKRLRSVRILSGSKEKDRNLRRITRMVLVVVAAFVVCWTPIQIMVLAQSLGFNLSSLFTLVLMHFCIALGYVNSSLNPVLYAFLDENFKRCFREFCHPSPFRLDTQQSGRMRSIAREVAAAYSCKAGDGGGPGGGTPNPA